LLTADPTAAPGPEGDGLPVPHLTSVIHELARFEHEFFLRK
jgi:hypothetical protein